MHEDTNSKRQGPPERTVTADAVEAFYDEFSVSRMQRYLQKGNIRIERAIKRIRPFVAADSTVLEIGCGVGLVTEQIAQAAPQGTIWSCDISERNIEQAKTRVKGANVFFRRCDILRDFDQLRTWLTAPIGLVAMVDVIEHLPLSTHAALLNNLTTIMSGEGLLILTFPSAEYQRYLQAESPEKLQIIDEVIELDHVVSTAASAGFRVKHFSLEDVWLRNQYVHCVLARSLSLERV